MNRLSAITRIAFSLVSLNISLLLTAKLMGLVPNERDAVMRARGRLCEMAATNASMLADKGTGEALRMLEYSLQELVKRHPDILSAAVRYKSEILAESGQHEMHWKGDANGRSSDTEMYVPLGEDGDWGSFEMHFRPYEASGGLIRRYPLVCLLAFMTTVGLVCYGLYLGRVLQQLNPSKVVPERVREALNTFAEGLLIVDDQGRIVLSNLAFARTAGCSRENLMGRLASSLKWLTEDGEALESMPWESVLETGDPCVGEMMQLMDSDSQETRSFQVNASPIVNPDGSPRGALLSFEDVTPLEQKKAELSRMVERLHRSADEIRRQNEELQRLATRDPLTNCLNRRSFFEKFETEWESAKRYDYPLSAFMVDIDHFKSINDNHGHSVGDEVLQKVAHALQGLMREGDIVCRYGGEEFAVLLPHTAIEDAGAAADKCREGIAALEFAELSVTASFGSSCTTNSAADPQELLDQADKALYYSKRSGRNRVSAFHEIPEDLEVDESKLTRTAPLPPPANAIPFHAVSALMGALSYRDRATAEHSRRVADLCVMTADGLMTRSDCYILEIAALLHDIGKVAVPDSLLRKAGKLTDEELSAVRRSLDNGADIIRVSFDSQLMSAIVESYRIPYGETDQGSQLPLGARILAIADAFDAMTMESPYRDAMSQGEAFKELRACSGTQFDGELVERFIATTRRLKTVKTKKLAVSRETALTIGLQLERLAAALDDHDLDALQVMATRLRETADRDGVAELAQLSSALERQVVADGDLLDILHSANELMQLCRSTNTPFVGQK